MPRKLRVGSILLVIYRQDHKYQTMSSKFKLFRTKVMGPVPETSNQTHEIYLLQSI